MALAQVVNYANRIEAGQIGHMALSLTNFDNNNEPAISAGSKIEIGGALFEAPGNEAIAGWGAIANSSDVWIRLTVVGAEATAAFTIVVPVWSLTKQGWYDAGETMRYIGGLYKDAGGNYIVKWLYTPENTFQMLREGQTRPLLEKISDIGNWNMDLTVSVDVAHGLGTLWGNIRSIDCLVRDDGNTLRRQLAAIDYLDGMADGAITYIDSTIIRLHRVAGGIYDNVNYDLTPYNRGWIYIKYQA